MSDQLMLFEGHEIVVLFKEDVKFDFQGDFLILAKNVATVLDYARTEEVTKFCKKEQVFVLKNSDISVSALNRIRKLNNAGEAFITNLALNRVFGKSEKPKAEPFQDWLYEDMLPSVQKHGVYMTPETIEKTLSNPDFIIGLATKLKEEQLARQLAETQIEKDKPKVLFADSVSASQTSLLIGDLAKLIKQNGYDIGQKRLFEWMRQNGYLMKSGSSKNMPTQKAMDKGLFEVKESSIANPDGSIRITKTTKVTGKGQIYFINKFISGDVA
ncbi:prophage antirepressor [Brevibacillus phage Jimmer1]|uniref:Prophage antirepressor n=4 Tax=Jimmervirus TaxID=1984788 RepID=S5M9F1_9CAUD|nr:anti-repressor [Brevibacillus phage Osiris]YP_009226329.1 anti-repressor [Brevibacillus phage Jimmer1]YP_009606446.1 anti-repressor [Brevibacillus phage Jimmer2]ALA48031.1 putative prophage antirepressor [Brevibacillus phage Powder]AGR47163.1 prophage antirepressor [Brevibacillus phage Jimmer2]AGR47264.1 prophage antirepressor [Brevibacillus phage Jimmer1]ALA07362.1 putative prophage antirepressor [Brevibacillus phage Osiris]